MSDLNELKEIAYLANEAGQGSPAMVEFRVSATPDVVIDMINQLEAAQQRIAELNDKWAQSEIDHCDTMNRAQTAEAELARRNATAGEPVAWRYAYLPNVGDDSGWLYAESEDLCNNSSGYIVQPLYAAPPAPSAPDGWKLVPIEPDWNMLSADGCKEHHEGKACIHHDNRKRIWRAMLSAVPAAPGGE